MFYKQFLIREEFFGFLIFDKKSGELFVSKDKKLLENISNSRIISLKTSNGLIDISEDQILVFDSKFRKSNLLSAPTYVEIYPTLFCNERCEFCYVGEALTNDLTVMSKETVDITLSKLKEIGVFEISILGGEPFLYKHLDYLVTQAVEKGFGITIATNGTAPKFDLYEKFTKLRVKLSVSFHSCVPSVTNAISNNPIAFDKKLSSIRFLCKTGIPPHITIVANSMNKESILDTVKFLCLEGITGLTIFHTMAAGYAKKNNEIGIDFWDYVSIIEKAKAIALQYGAKLTGNTNFPFLLKGGYAFKPIDEMQNLFYGTIDGRRALYINYNGDIFPTVYEFSSPQLCLGNITNGNLNDIWDKSEILEEIRTAVPKPCNKCRYFNYCRGEPITNYDLSFFTKDSNRKFSCPLINEVLTE